MSSVRRADRVAEAIREEVATFLATGAKDPRILGFVTVTGVELTRDLRNARVYVSIIGSDAHRATTLEGLASVAVRLRAHVGQTLQLRLAPSIEFRIDSSAERAARIESLLASIKTSPEHPPPGPDGDE